MPDQYPQIAAGDELTADLLMSMLPRCINKPNDTARQNTATPADDPDLTMQLEANATYFVEFHIHYAAVDAAQFRTDWTVPSGASGNRCVLGMSPSNLTNTNADNATGRYGVHAYATDVTYGTRNHATNQAYALETATVVTTSAGTLALRWAQLTSNAGFTTVFSTSFMRVTRLA